MPHNSRIHSPLPPHTPHTTPNTPTPTTTHHPKPQERERLYLELKGVLARAPGPEAGEALGLYQASLRDKTKQM